uniref:Gastric triacylglycerol lipase n=1 Tax=Neovison vison TaxID=452646 RepID=A0A8C7CEZ1_NEOVI
MSYLFRVTSLILILGTMQGAFLYRRAQNPEVNMNISQIISYWGYPDEMYDIVTEDGYILGLYRIPYGKTNSGSSGNIQFRTTCLWIQELHSRGFQLCFFFCSFDEMAKYDLPASIDFIVKHTGQEEIFYVGHSQGTTIAFITFSTIPQIAERIKIFFALAPVFSIKYSKSPLIKLAYKWRSVLKAFFGNKDFLPNTSFKRFVGSKLCPLKIIGKICRDILFMIYGYDQENLNMSRVDVYLSHNPAGTSVQNMLHWSQVFHSSHLRAFDWGSPALNLVHFNQSTSPYYDVRNMNVSTATWNGGNDLLADPQDVKNLLSEITNPIYHKTISCYNHIDFLFGLDVYQQVYHEIIDIIQDKKKEQAQL